MATIGPPFGSSVPPAVYGVPIGPPAERPTAAFVLTLASGILIALFGLALIGFESILAAYGLPPSYVQLLVVLDAVSGALVIVLGTLLYLRPEHHVALGALVLVASLVSLPGGGGAILGLVLGIVGGSLGIAFRPNPIPPAVFLGTPPPQRLCLRCGRGMAPDARYCPSCGQPAQ